MTTIQTAYYGQMCVLYKGFGSIGFVTLVQPFPNGLLTIGWMSLVSGGYSRSNSIVPLMLRMVCCAMAKALAIYYRSIKTAPTLLRRGNISGSPCMRVMTCNALAFSCIKTIK
jgi:hypothetical protein